MTRKSSAVEMRNAILRNYLKRCFVPVTRSVHSFHPGSRDLGRKVRDLANWASPASHTNQIETLRRKEWRGREISVTEPAYWPGSYEETRVRIAKAVKTQSKLAWNNLFVNFSTLSWEFHVVPWISSKLTNTLHVEKMMAVHHWTRHALLVVSSNTIKRS